MKFLKNIGRKIKKGLKKLMSNKIGRIVGMIGLSMAMGYAAKALIGQFGAGAVAGEVAGEAVVGATVGETVGTAGLTEGVGASLLEGTVATEAISAPLIEEITISAAKRAGAGQINNTLSMIEKASTNSDAFNIASNAMESNTVATIDGINYVNPDMATVHNNITSAVDHQFKTTFDPNATQRFTGYGPDTEFYTRSGVEGSAVTPPVVDTVELYDPLQGRIEAGIDQETLARKLSETGKFTGAVEGAGQGSLLDPVTVPLPQPEEVLPFGERAKDWLSETFIPDDPQEFIGDVGKGVVTGELLSVIGGEPEEQFYSKGISAKVQPIAPQAAYITAITPSYQAAMNTDAIPNFQQLKDANLVGTGSLQWMNMFGRQPLIFPNVLGLPS